jgi:hypothetical protein
MPAAVLFMCAVAMVAVQIAGCIIRPKPVQHTMPSYDGNEANSGVIELFAGDGARITDHARDRYNALALKYGTRFEVPVKPDDGIKPGLLSAGKPTWLIDREHLVKWRQMEFWKAQPAPP